MSDATTKRKVTTKSKRIPWGAIRVDYAKKHDMPIDKASKKLRGKLRNAYGKDKVVTSYIDRKGTNRDGNRYPDATAAERKALLNL